MDPLTPSEWLDQAASEDPYLDEAGLLTLFSQRVQELLDQNPDLLFSFLYRLDIDEVKIKQSFQTENPVAALATLIIERQKARIQSKAQYGQPPAEPLDF
jgi:hypothetical protein